ncbi:hypothetical protein WA026_003331 [Henosepilachna vigintioctopunctata]|uniref:Uncharacterized protein n=1 Tax=Henosepilachna vigintioctopunctata TaxID=420089 RepID=A0AAW1TR09_9CUCU
MICSGSGCSFLIANGEDAVMALVVFHRPGRSPDSLSTPDAPDWAGPILSKRAKRLKAKQRALQGLEPEEEESTLTKCLVPLMASLRFLDNSSPERVPMRGVEVNLEMVPMRGVEVNLQMPPAAIRDQPRPPLESIDDQPGPSSRRRINYDQPGTSSQFMDSQPGPSSRGRIHNDQPGTSYQMMDSQPGPSSLRRIDYDKPGTSSEMMDTQPGPSSLGRIDYDKPGTSSQLMDIQPGPSSQEHIYDILRPSSKIIEIKPKKHLSRSARVHPTPSTSKIVDVRYRKGEKFGSMLKLLRSFDSPQSGSTQSDEEASHILVSPDSSILERSLNEEESDYAMVGPRREAYGNFQGKGPRIKKSGKK